ncbi:hypothetical protein [Alicyclobacillus sp. SO9]|uniref:hypothetical protein n=1 Tax=Alicyclobacillus sp. SO9 TaxID=2665646 RepID=UPI0018E7989A|nr:hypothetical protein [Alicyclobacillus sp. SO9]QQE79659.1 hypothetical protein GI364_03990 [Alicyclobacillus sp. SO9]
MARKGLHHRTQTRNGLVALQYSIDFFIAILLLTGAISTSGIFVVPEGFFLAATGPVFGSDLFEGKSAETSIGLRAVNVIVAILLILNVIRVTGPYITSQRAIIVFSGEIFGINEIAEVVGLDEMDRDVAFELRQYVRSQLLHEH